MHPILADIFGPDLIIVIIVVAVVLFGGTQIPKLARSLGSAQSEFKKGLAEGGKSTDAQPPAGGANQASGNSATGAAPGTEGANPAAGSPPSS